MSLRRQDILEPTAIRGTDDHGDHRRLTITSADPRERRPDPTTSSASPTTLSVNEAGALSPSRHPTVWASACGPAALPTRRKRR